MGVGAKLGMGAWQIRTFWGRVPEEMKPELVKDEKGGNVEGQPAGLLVS